MTGPAPISGSAPDASAQFAQLASTAHKITRFILANPGDAQARDDLKYVVGKMQGPQGAGAAAANADQAAIPRDVGPLGTFVQNAGNTMSMGAGNAIAQGTAGNAVNWGAANALAPQQGGTESGKVIDASNAANPSAALWGKVTGVVAPLLAGDWTEGWPAMKALTKIPRLGFIGLMRAFGEAAQADKEVAPAAAKAAARLIEEAPAEEAEHLSTVKKELFDSPGETQPLPESSSAINAPRTYPKLEAYAKELEGMTKTQLQSHLNWTMNRLEQGPWMQDNMRVIVQEMAKRGMVSGAKAP